MHKGLMNGLHNNTMHLLPRGLVFPCHFLFVFDWAYRWLDLPLATMLLMLHFYRLLLWLRLTLDSTIHRINRYPVDKYMRSQLSYPLDSELSGGQRNQRLNNRSLVFIKWWCEDVLVIPRLPLIGAFRTSILVGGFRSLALLVVKALVRQPFYNIDSQLSLLIL